MAYLRLGYINTGLKRCINYILNPEKTKNQSYVGSHNIVLTKGNLTDIAYNAMMETKDMFNKHEGRQGYHYKLSFASEDTVTPEIALKITNEFCEKCFGNYECIYSVHDNTKHLHSHIVFNSIDMVEGLKYHYKKGDWASFIQPRVNAICKSYGLSELNLAMDEEYIIKHKCKDYATWKDPDRVFYSNAMIKADVMSSITLASSYKEFISLMQEKGHRVDDSGKYIKVLAPGRERFCRLYKLDPDYMRDNIIQMINGTFMSREEVREKLVNEWNAHAPIRIKFVRIDLSTLRVLEEQKLIAEKGLYAKEDLEAYIDYLERGDKELNIIKKKVINSFTKRQAALDKLDELMKLMPLYARFNKGETSFFNEHEKAKELAKDIANMGFHIEKLYQYKCIGDALIKSADDYKKRIYIEKKICERIKEKNAVIPYGYHKYSIP